MKLFANLFERKDSQQLYEDNVNKIGELLQDCDNLLFITGAGISAESGVPTFRGIGGFYIKEVIEGMHVEDFFSGKTMREKPELLWQTMLEMEKQYRNNQYNIAHKIIADLEQYFAKIVVLTMNIDGFHRQAGSTNVIDIHGDIYQLYCMGCLDRVIVKDYSHLSKAPRCQKCQSFMRPDVVLFNEMLSEDKFNSMVEFMEEGVDMAFAIGTTALFPYITMPLKLFKKNKIPTIEINPNKTRISRSVDIRVAASATKAMSDIYQSYLQKK